MRLGVEAALVRGVLVAGDVDVEEGVIVDVGLAGGTGGRIAVPGFVDLQVNGFGGVDFLAAATEDYVRAGEALLLTGVTAYQPTFITASESTLVDALHAVPANGARPRILGAHLEGPFLSPERLGTHPQAHRRDPDLERDRGGGARSVRPGRVDGNASVQRDAPVPPARSGRCRRGAHPG